MTLTGPIAVHVGPRSLLDRSLFPLAFPGPVIPLGVLVGLFAAFALMLALFASPAQAGTVDVALPADGRDVTATVQRAIDSAPNGSTIHFPAGRFRLDGTILVRNRSSLTFEGASGARTVFFATGRGPLNSRGLSWRRHFAVAGGRDITIRRLHIEGANTVSNQHTGYGDFLPAYEHEHGFSFAAVDGGRLEDSSVKGVFGDGAYIGNDGYDLGSSSTPARNIRLTRVSLTWIGRQGVGVTHAEQVLLEGLRVHARLCGIDLEPNQSYQYTNQVEVRNSTIDAVLIAFGATGPGAASGVLLHHNTVEYNGNWPVVSHDMVEGRSSGWVVEDNLLRRTLSSSRHAGMEFYGIRNLAVRRNSLTFQPGSLMTAILLRDVTGSVEISGNVFSGAARLYSSSGVAGSLSLAGNSTDRSAAPLPNTGASAPGAVTPPAASPPGATAPPAQPPVSPGSTLPRFPDALGSWYYDFALKMAQEGFMEGFADGTFGGERPFSRGQFSAVIARMLEIEPGGSASFSDTAGFWGAGYVAALAARGIINGYDDGSFRPYQSITRAQIAAIMDRARLREQPHDMSEARMDDLREKVIAALGDVRGHWATDHIAHLFTAGVVQGDDQGRFRPDAAASRAQASALLWRWFEAYRD